MPDAAKSSQKAKFNCIQENLSSQGVMIRRVDCLQYVDRYYLQTDEGEIIIDCQYNGSGMYTAYRSQNQNTVTDKILECFRDESTIEYGFNYIPSLEQFSVLYTNMLSICDDLKVTITNIVEHKSQYFVVYYLKTSGKFSQIIFYFKSNGFITHAMPSSDLGEEDSKMVELINRLTNTTIAIQ